MALASSGPAFDYNGYKAGSVCKKQDVFEKALYTDSNDGGIVHAVMLMNSGFVRNEVTSSDALDGESKMNFHFTNGFRLYHGKKVLKWSDKAFNSARMHSKDMAANNYFSHESLDGTKSSQRMTESGIHWTGCAENIAAGRSDGIGNYNGWVNSSGHRNNMLGNYTYLGVGGAHNHAANYSWYFTQNFYK